MSYIKADDILPEEIIALIQEYVDGETIYIPRKAENRRGWGCGTDYRAELTERNKQIRQDHQAGAAIAELAARYYLSEKSIRRILRDTEE